MPRKKKNEITSGKPGTEGVRDEWNRAAQAKLPIADVPIEEREDIALSHKLTPEELDEIADLHAAAKTELDRRTAKIEKEKAESKKRIAEIASPPKDAPGDRRTTAELEALTSRCAAERESKERVQPVPCRVVKDPRLQEVRIYRLDRGGPEGELIEEGEHRPRAMTGDERESFVFGVPPDDDPPVLDPPEEE